MSVIPRPDRMKINNLETYIEDGSIKVPKFQRDFVWEVKKSAELLDSILKGSPIGTIIFLKTTEKLQSIKDIGGFELKKQKKTGETSYILDGQQRITSLYACLKGFTIKGNDYSNIFVYLDAADDEQIVFTEIDELDKKKIISFKEIYNMNITAVNKKYKTAKLLNRIQELNSRLKDYELSIIEVENAEIDLATDIFTRINVSGKPLSVFEIMCAKIYDEKNKFDLADKVKDLLDDWSACDYETISTTTILQCVAMCLKKSCKNKIILKLKREDFVNSWDSIVKSMNAAIEFFQKAFGIAVSKLLPYDALLVPFTYFFYLNKNKTPSKEITIKYLKDYFWRCVFNQRFTEGVTGKLQVDVQNVIEVIYKGGTPTYSEGVDISTRFLEQKGEFSTGSAIAKGILCLLSSKTPLSFTDGSKVKISNDWLLQSNSKNYHHFFPKKYMKNKQHREDKVNHIANITILDSETNQKIKANAPSDYIQWYKTAQNFNSIMKSHLIGDIDEFGINKNNYDTFFKKRLELFNQELQKLIICKEGFDIF